MIFILETTRRLLLETFKIFTQGKCKGAPFSNILDEGGKSSGVSSRAGGSLESLHLGFLAD